MRILLWDLETSPHEAYTWGLFDQNISLAQLRKPGEVICFAAKWLDEKKMHFSSVHHHDKEEMLQHAWDLLNEADALVGWNSKSFDTKTMAKEFLLAGMPPPSPAKEIDLMRAAKARFRLASTKLEFVSRELGLEGKVQHEGFQLWVDCLAGDDRAWSKMRTYCKRDVQLLEPLYYKLRPWIPNHPSVPLYGGTGDDACPTCGSTELVKQGFAYTKLGRFQQYRCPCGRWSRSGRRLEGVDVREAV